MQLIWVFLLVAADRLSKVLAEALLQNGELVTVIPGVIGFELLHGGNTGAAFGLFSGKTDMLVLVSLVCSCVFVWLLYKKRFTHLMAKWGFILLCAGAIGNLYDRMVYGSVTDFIVFLFMQFPTFNLADCFIDIGAVVYSVYALFIQKEDSLFVKDNALQPAEAAENEENTDAC